MTDHCGRILVADDEVTMLELFEETLSGRWEVVLARDGREAAALLDQQTFDLAFLDLRMPGYDGAELLQRIRAKDTALPTVLMSAHAGEARRNELMAGGADLFLEKPFLPDLIERTAQDLFAGDTREPERMIAKDPAMLHLLKLLDRVAPTRATILLDGETGTGKELLAHEIHRRSGRRDQPFVQVNCAALSEGLLESELFGHERGSFTGAFRAHEGLFRAAHNGTLLLDEVGEISLSTQAKLLRVLQEREVRRVGSASTVPVDVRILATTNRDLSNAVHTGCFRLDLYHRLNVVRLSIPPLRSRPDDLEPLVHAILERKALEHELPRLHPAAAALVKLQGHTWPGNVRELENVLERALLMAGGPRLEATDIALDSAHSTSPLRVGTSLRDAERALILGTLKSTQGHRTRAAQVLGISARTLRNKMKEYREAGLLNEEETE